MEKVKIIYPDNHDNEIKKYIEILEEGKPDVNNNEALYCDGIASMEGKSGVSFGYLKIYKRPLVISLLERHAKCKELMVMLKGNVYIPLCENGNGEGMVVLYLPQGKAILVKKGIWHALPLPLSEEANMLIAFEPGTFKNDTEVQNLPHKVNF